MADRWVPNTDHYPHRCRRTGHSGVDYGPYFHDEIPFRAGLSETTFDRDNPDREQVLYLSRQWVQDIISAPGSPFACITHEELDAIRDKLAITLHDFQALEALHKELEDTIDDRVNRAVAARMEALDEAIKRLAGAEPPAPSGSEPAKATRRKAAG